MPLFCRTEQLQEAMKLDIDYVRSQFNQFIDRPEFVFAANAGGSYVSNQANQVLEHYNQHMRVQPYSRFEPSATAGIAMDKAREGWSKMLNIDASELTFGPSTSMNTYVMAQAIGDLWQPGDEIIVTNQDHEANSGVWRRKAAEKGVTIRQWEVDKDTGLLDIDSLLPLLNENTRWVFFTHCSNIAGTTNPVKTIVHAVKANSGAHTFVDGVAHAPHHIPNLKDLEVDCYVFSLYKVYGPHQGILYVRNGIHGYLTSQAHYFNTGVPTKDFNPAGPQHAQVAGCAGVVEYFEQLHEHHAGPSDVSILEKLADIREAIAIHETALTAPILDYLDNHRDIRLLGKAHCGDGDRVPTIAFASHSKSSHELAYALQDENIGTENGHFYAHRLISDVGIKDPDDGVVRLSLLHYNSLEDVDRILLALDKTLPA